MMLTTEIPLPKGATEHAVRFSSGDDTLAGNLIRCDAAHDRAVLFIHGFGGVRSGPHNMLTTLARELADIGVPSLRFDLSGRGESSGLPPETTLSGMAEDALSAARLLKSEVNVTNLTIVGICSGGNVGIGILDRLPECDSLFLLSVYPFGDADSFRRDAQRSAAMLKEYWKRLWIKDTWLKLIRGKIHFGIIARILLKPFARAAAQETTSDTDSATGSQTHPLDNLLISSPRVTMIYGDADPEFGLSTAYYREFAKKNDYPVTIETFPGANHNFYSMTWKKEITQRLLRYVEET